MNSIITFNEDDINSVKFYATDQYDIFNEDEYKKIFWYRMNIFSSISLIAKESEIFTEFSCSLLSFIPKVNCEVPSFSNVVIFLKDFMTEKTLTNDRIYIYKNKELIGLTKSVDLKINTKDGIRFVIEKLS